MNPYRFTPDDLDLARRTLHAAIPTKITGVVLLGNYHLDLRFSASFGSGPRQVRYSKVYSFDDPAVDLGALLDEQDDRETFIKALATQAAAFFNRRFA